LSAFLLRQDKVVTRVEAEGMMVGHVGEKAVMGEAVVGEAIVGQRVEVYYPQQPLQPALQPMRSSHNKSHSSDSGQKVENVKRIETKEGQAADENSAYTQGKSNDCFGYI
jgi:hypothetical protein